MQGYSEALERAQCRSLSTDEEDRRRRLRTVRRGVGEILGLGLAYYLFTQITHLYIPCPIRLVTGWLCPGCGISHLFIHLFHLEFAEAFADNPFVMILLPFALVYALYRGHRYVSQGATGYAWWETTLFTLTFAAAIGFAVWRNLHLAGVLSAGL